MTTGRHLEAPIHGANALVGKPTVLVETTSTLILAANQDRRYALLVNISSTDVDINFGAAAENDKGTRLYAYGGSYEINKQNQFCGAIYGIHAGSGTKKVQVTEGQ
jgi:nitrous oxidase accessory protein NosD